MRFVFLVLMVLSGVFANEFGMNEECIKCHGKIYREYTLSMHANSTPELDEVHAMVWNKHPKNKKMNQYSCAKCHMPAADNLKEMTTKGGTGVPDDYNFSHMEAISCSSCHRIKAIQSGKKSNTNIVSEPYHYYGTLENPKEVKKHKQISDNPIWLNGNVCMGCHSHKTNKSGFEVCRMENGNTQSSNCITCHMPQVDGAPSKKNAKRKTHAFHGFAGLYNNREMLTKYIKLSVEQNSDGFVVKLFNQAPHALVVHPMRMVELRTKVISKDGKEKAFEPIQMARVLGKKSTKKPAPPWVADVVLKNDIPQSNRITSYPYMHKIAKGDRVDVDLGFYFVNPKIAKKFKAELARDKVTFTSLKKVSTTF
jgi:nitrate reductase cytochrome c-type subunit